MFRYLFQGKSPIKQFRMLCGLFPVYAAAIGAALLYPPGRKPAYRLNNRAPFQEMRPWHCLLPQMLVVLLHLTLPLLSLQFGWAPVKLVVFNALFSAFVIWVLADVIMVSLKQPRFAPAMDPRQVYGV
jgi:cellulose synthase (UDP-forming)